MLALPVGMISSDGPCYEKRLKPRFSSISPVQLDFPFKAMACLFKLHSSVTPSVLRPKRTTKTYHEHHVYVITNVIGGVDKFLVT